MVGAGVAPGFTPKQNSKQIGNDDWAADKTPRLEIGYLRSWEGIVYFAFIIDVFSRRVVG